MPDYTARDLNIGAPKLGLHWRLRVAQSVSSTVEEDSQVGFHIGLIDLQEGALGTGDIDISSIAVTIEKSTGGGAFSSAGLTAATFSEASGRVYVAYRFLAAQWAVGDMYRLTVSGITCTISNETAYVPSVVWSNLVVESSELAADVDDIDATLGQLDDAAATGAVTSADTAMAYLKQIINEILGTDGAWGNLNNEAISSLDLAIQYIAAVIGFNGANVFDPVVGGVARTSLERVYNALDVMIQTIDDNVDWNKAALGHGTWGLGALYNEINANEAKIDTVNAVVDLIWAALGHSTWGLGALKTLIQDNQDKIDIVDDNVDWNKEALGNDTWGLGALHNDIVSAVDQPPTAKSLHDILHKDGTYSFDNTSDSLEAIRDAIDAQADMSATDKGVKQTFEVAVTSAANAGDTTLATIASGSVIIESIVVFAVAAQHGDMTSATVVGGAAKVIKFITAQDLLQADVDAEDKQVSWEGRVRLNTGDTILMEHAGTGVGALNLVVAITFYASDVDGATMS